MGSQTAAHLCINLLLHDLQHFHGAGLDADAAGNALGGGAFGLQHHDLHGAGFHALPAADALLLVDHVNAGLGILSDGLMLAGAHALATLDAGHRLGTAALGNNLDAGQILIEFLIERLGAGLNALQAGHTLGIFLNNELLHSKELPFSIFIVSIIHIKIQKSNDKN